MRQQMGQANAVIIDLSFLFGADLANVSGRPVLGPGRFGSRFVFGSYVRLVLLSTILCWAPTAFQAQ